MDVLGTDFETYCELNLTEVGASRYARHKSCEVLMLAYALNHYAVEQWVPAEGQKMPADLLDMLRDPKIRKRAWNAPFEWQIFKHVLGILIPIREWRDTMVMALSCSLPGKLEAAAPILRLPANKEKDTRGKLLIRTFCAPRTPTKHKPWTRTLPEHEPERWHEFKQYNCQDVEAERGVADTLMPWDLPEHEWELWALDREINERGLPINMRVVEQALRISGELTRRHMLEMMRITGLENPNSGPQLLGWLRDRNYPFNDLKKGHVQREVDAEVEYREKNGIDTPSNYERVLSLRRETSKASIKKFNALQRATDEDGRLRNTLQFAAAGRTWRWGGRIYQPQNLVRPPKWIEKIQVQAVEHLEYGNTRMLEAWYGTERVPDLISACVRPVVQASPGHVFVDADLNAIENRLLGWMADDRKILRVFELNRDPYIDFATYMYREEYSVLFAQYKAGDGAKRQIAKPGVLGCGYMLSAGKEYENRDTGEIEATGLLGYGRAMGVNLTPEQAELSVRTWRNTFEDAVNYWYEIENAAKRTIRNKREYEAGPIWFSIDGPFLLMHLPSGRSLKYLRPRLEAKMMPWGKQKEVITYEGLDDKNNWVRLQTHPGKLTENGDQAIARDVLAHGLTLADREGLDIFLHVHDQGVAEVREKDADKWLKVLIDCMSEVPKWAPGLPLKANGHVSKYFIKD